MSGGSLILDNYNRVMLGSMIVLGIVMIGVAGLAIFTCFAIQADYDNKQIIVTEGFVIDTEYSQSGFGSSDITVVYFKDNRTFVIYDTVEVPRNTFVKISLTRVGGDVISAFDEDVNVIECQEGA